MTDKEKSEYRQAYADEHRVYVADDSWGGRYAYIKEPTFNDVTLNWETKGSAAGLIISKKMPKHPGPCSESLVCPRSQFKDDDFVFTWEDGCNSDDIPSYTKYGTVRDCWKRKHSMPKSRIIPALPKYLGKTIGEIEEMLEDGENVG